MIRADLIVVDDLGVAAEALASCSRHEGPWMGPKPHE
jgi:hypothetical protein